MHSGENHEGCAEARRHGQEAGKGLALVEEHDGCDDHQQACAASKFGRRS